MHTRFSLCVSWTLAVEWDKEEGQLEEGDEVTVFGEKSRQPVNLSSFWGTVTKVINAEKEECEITDKNGNKHYPARADLRHRKSHHTITGHVSDDKSHGKYAMQHFLCTELKDLKDYDNQLSN